MFDFFTSVILFVPLAEYNVLNEFGNNEISENIQVILHAVEVCNYSSFLTKLSILQYLKIHPRFYFLLNEILLYGREVEIFHLSNHCQVTLEVCIESNFSELFSDNEQ